MKMERAAGINFSCFLKEGANRCSLLYFFAVSEEMIGVFGAAAAFIGGFALGAVAWLVYRWLHDAMSIDGGWENKEAEKDAIADLVAIMNEHDIEELEINDSGFRIKRR